LTRSLAGLKVLNVFRRLQILFVQLRKPP